MLHKIDDNAQHVSSVDSQGRAALTVWYKTEIYLLLEKPLATLAAPDFGVRL